MRTRTKVWLIIAVSFVLLGGILFAGVMTTLKWDFMRLSTVRYETNTYEVSEKFDSIVINVDTADIVLAPSDDGKCRVECHEEENARHSVVVEEGILAIELFDERTVNDFIGHIGLNFDSAKITVYLPKKEFASLDISVATGDVTISNVTCKGDVISSGSTGDILLNNVIAKGKFSIVRSTGDVKFDRSDAAEIFVKTNTGDITGSLLTDKEIVADTDTGDVEIYYH